jgi:hypothetical protein
LCHHFDERATPFDQWHRGTWFLQQPSR